MMGDMHIRNLRQKSLLRQRTEEAVKKLQVLYVRQVSHSFSAAYLCGASYVQVIFYLRER